MSLTQASFLYSNDATNEITPPTRVVKKTANKKNADAPRYSGLLDGSYNKINNRFTKLYTKPPTADSMLPVPQHWKNQI